MSQTDSLLRKSQEPTSFTRFNDLPPELRLIIWSFALPEARTVVVHSPFRRRELASLDAALPLTVEDSKPTWQSTSRIPALLHTSVEARMACLKNYSLSLGVGDAKPRIYVDFSRDTIFFGDEELTPECASLWARTKDLRKARRLAIVPEGGWRALRWMTVVLDCLQKIIFVHDTEKVKLGPTAELVEDAESNGEASWEMELEQHLQLLASSLENPLSASPSPVKQRIKAAREELATLKIVLPMQWKVEPAVSTAVFTNR